MASFLHGTRINFTTPSCLMFDGMDTNIVMRCSPLLRAGLGIVHVLCQRKGGCLVFGRVGIVCTRVKLKMSISLVV